MSKSGRYVQYELWHFPKFGRRKLRSAVRALRRILPTRTLICRRMEARLSQ